MPVEESFDETMEHRLMGGVSVSPNIEDGFTKIANELLEAVIRFGFSSRQFAVLLALMRKTYGYNKKTDDIGLSQLEKMTGIDKSNIAKTVRQLCDMRVINRAQGVFGHKLSINKHYSQWRVVNSTTANSVVKTTTPPVVKTTTPPVVKTTTTKDNPSKDNLSKEKNLLCKPACTEEKFDSFWSIWPKKRSKKEALKAFKALSPDDELMKTILAAIEARKQTHEWMKAGGDFVPLPASWLRAEAWSDEIKPVVGSFNKEHQEFIDVFNTNIGAKCGQVEEWSQQIEDRIAMALVSGKWDLARWASFWQYVRDRCPLITWPISIEWLLDRNNLVKVTRGDYQG